MFFAKIKKIQTCAESKILNVLPYTFYNFQNPIKFSVYLFRFFSIGIGLTTDDQVRLIRISNIA